MKVAQFNVRATMPQSIRWKQAAEGEGFASVGAWAASALDAYLEARTRAGKPIPLCWHRGTFRAVLVGQEVPVRGMVSPPFGIYRGTAEAAGPRACNRFTLVHLPARRVIATLRTMRQSKTLASEMAPLLLRDEARASTLVARHVAEQA